MDPKWKHQKLHFSNKTCTIGEKMQDRQSSTPYLKCQTCQNTHEYQHLPPHHDQF